MDNFFSDLIKATEQIINYVAPLVYLIFLKFTFDYK